MSLHDYDNLLFNFKSVSHSVHNKAKTSGRAGIKRGFVTQLTKVCN